MISFCVIGVALAVLVQQLLMFGLQRACHPLRLRLASEGERLLASGDLTDEASRHVRFLLSTAFSMRIYLIMAIFIVPVMAVVGFFKPSSVTKGLRISLTDNADTTVRFRNLSRAHHVITAANNPILNLIVLLEIDCTLTPALVLRAVLGGVLSPSPSAQAIIVQVGEKLERKRHRFIAQETAAVA